MACSWDGSVAYIEFDDKELGQVVSTEEKENLFQRMYGKKSFATGPDKKAPLVVEDPDWIQPKSVTTPTPSVIDDMHSSDSRASRSSQIIMRGPTDKQIETRTVDGKRRITPVFIPPPMEEDEAPTHHLNNGQAPGPIAPPTFSSSSVEKSKIVIEKRDEVTRAGLPSAPSSSPPSSAASMLLSTTAKEVPSILLTRRLERSEPERKVVSVKSATVNNSSIAMTGISIVRPPDSDKIAIPPITVQKTFAVLVSWRLNVFQRKSENLINLFFLFSYFADDLG